MSKLGILGGCIYEFQRVVDWRACFEVARTCVTFVGDNWWMRKNLFAVGGGLEDVDMFFQNR